MNNKQPLVGILMGSDSDLEVMNETVKVLEQFSVPHEIVITSAHRSPKRTTVYVESAEKRGLHLLIAGAGYAAHLAGVLAAHTTLPVIGVPIDSSSLQGLDALLSTAQMPGGVPVACMGIGKAGAKNAGILAVEVLALQDPELKKKLIQYRQEMEKKLAEKNRQVGGGEV
ncbi:MAG: 5-(carboxyamino)imidazole ribonucleotide mutase [Deltaproteobacteria bacterium]|nr:5-(carboxyamino)imidazole ribonucleotide mutase [Deltaproteobacteria bacterium]